VIHLLRPLRCPVTLQPVIFGTVGASENVGELQCTHLLQTATY
jgi:hypothetical protein